MTRSEHSAPVASTALMPAFLVTGLPSEPAAAAAELGVSFASFGPARGGAWQADFDLPRGTSWRLLPDYGAALWLARDTATSLPPIACGCRGLELDVLAAVLRLAAVEGVWLTEARLLSEAVGWTGAIGGSTALRLMAQLPDVVAVSGTWSDRRGRAVTGELHRDSRIWAETHVQAEQWLLAAAELELVSAVDSA